MIRTILILLFPIICMAQTIPKYTKNQLESFKYVTPTDSVAMITNCNYIVSGGNYSFWDKKDSELFYIDGGDDEIGMGDSRKTGRLNILSSNATPEDSLFTTELPTLTNEDNAVTIGLKIIPAKQGKVTALRYYKTTNGTAFIALWDAVGTKMTQGTLTGTGWQRLDCNIPVSQGNTYVVSVTTNPGRYGSSTQTWPRVKGNLSATGSVYSYGTSIQYPTKPSTQQYYIDAVFSSDAPAVPLTALIPVDSIDLIYPWKDTTLTGFVTGAVSYQWTVEDRVGEWIVKDTNTLRPIVRPLNDSSESLFMMLTARDGKGNERAAVVFIYAIPNPDEVVGYILRSNRIVWKRRIVIL